MSFKGWGFFLLNWSISNKAKLIHNHLSVNNEDYSNWNKRELLKNYSPEAFLCTCCSSFSIIRCIFQWHSENCLAQLSAELFTRHKSQQKLYLQRQRWTVLHSPPSSPWLPELCVHNSPSLSATASMSSLMRKWEQKVAAPCFLSHSFGQ